MPKEILLDKFNILRVINATLIVFGKINVENLLTFGISIDEENKHFLSGIGRSRTSRFVSSKIKCNFVLVFVQLLSDLYFIPFPLHYYFYPTDFLLNLSRYWPLSSFIIISFLYNDILLSLPHYTLHLF